MGYMEQLNPLLSPAFGDQVLVTDISEPPDSDNEKRIDLGELLLSLGKPGGRVVYGGTGSGETLDLIGSTHAAFGTVRLQPNGGTTTVGGGLNVSSGRSTLSNIRSGDTGPIGDDNVVTITGLPDPCMLLLWPTSGSTSPTIVSFRTNAPATQLVATNNEAQVTTMTGVLSGTTGTDGRVNFSCSGGTVYIENRRGFGIRYYYTVLG